MPACCCNAGPSTAAASEPPTPAEDTDPPTHLPDCIAFTARMLESLFSDSNTSRTFVEQGGIQALLGLYTIPKLPPTFGCSPPAQYLMAALRTFTAAHADTLSVQLNQVLSAQLEIALAQAKVRTALGALSQPRVSVMTSGR